VPVDVSWDSAWVSRVIDGGKIVVTLYQTERTVQYLGIQAPATDLQIFAANSTFKNQQLVEGKMVTLVRDLSQPDPIDRLLRYVFVDQTFVNYALLREGYARVDEQQKGLTCAGVFQQAELQARQERVGLWVFDFFLRRTPTPIPPIATARIFLPTGYARALCDCTGPDLDCGDFFTQAQAQACFERCMRHGYGDIFHLDSNRDGIVCPRLP
jgi:endonuclease YncB( thermonuclease family)